MNKLNEKEVSDTTTEEVTKNNADVVSRDLMIICFILFFIVAGLILFHSMHYESNRALLSHQKVNLVELHKENSEAFIHSYNKIILENTNQAKPEEIKIDITNINRGNYPKFLTEYTSYKTKLYFDGLNK